MWRHSVGLHGRNSDDNGLAVCGQNETDRLSSAAAAAHNTASRQVTERICHPLSLVQKFTFVQSGRWGT